MQSEASIIFPVLLAPKQHRLAEKFKRLQSNPKKAEQVYLNALAVFAVEFYLRCMGIETDWKSSLSWDPVAQSLMDVADLKVTGLGFLECRPVWSKAQFVDIPLEVLSNRIGYVAVEFDESLTEGRLLGFTEIAPENGELPISQLRSLHNLLEHLHQLRQPKPIMIPANLSLWLQNIYEPSWQSLESLFGTSERNLLVSFRNSDQLQKTSVKRGKLINLGLQLRNQSLTLLVIVTKSAEQPELTVRVQLHPAVGEMYLPPNVKLALLSETGETLDDAESRSWGFDNFIQLYEFSGLPGEYFSLKVACGDAELTETFVI